MKFLICLLLLPFAVHAQKAVLVDRNLLQPTKLANDVSFEQLSKGHFPIYYNDVPGLIETANQFLKMSLQTKNQNLRTTEFTVGNTVFFAYKEHGSLQYRIILRTTCSNMATSIVVAEESSLKKSLQHLSIFIDYLRNNYAAMK